MTAGPACATPGVRRARLEALDSRSAAAEARRPDAARSPHGRRGGRTRPIARRNAAPRGRHRRHRALARPARFRCGSSPVVGGTAAPHAALTDVRRTTRRSSPPPGIASVPCAKRPSRSLENDCRYAAATATTHSWRRRMGSPPSARCHGLGAIRPAPSFGSCFPIRTRPCATAAALLRHFGSAESSDVASRLRRAPRCPHREPRPGRP